MTALEHVEWESCLLEVRPHPELEVWVRQQTGRPASDGPRYFTPVPWVLRTLFPLERTALLSLSPRLADLTALVVSRDNACRFCYAAARLLFQILGVPERRIDRIEEDLFNAELDPRDKQALDFVRRLSRANPPPSPGDVKALRDAGFDEAAIKELAFVACAYVVVNRVTTLAAVPPQRLERLRGSWRLKLARPLLRRVLAKSRHRRGEATPLPPERRRGPFSQVVLPFDGLPVAHLLRDDLDAAWASPVLPRRAKALVFTVVAHGLGARRVEDESRELLREEGLDGDQVDELIAHLSSPALDAKERGVLAYARETIFYEPASIQRRGRNLLETLSPTELIELIGLASYANAVGRLSFVTEAL